MEEKNGRKDVDTNKIWEFVSKYGVTYAFVELLLSRGIALDEIDNFMRPDLSNLINPYEINNMKEVVERLKLAIALKQRVMVFGDYDCDGICATSILMLALKDKLDIKYHLPKREDGYGLTKESIDKAIGRWKPDLFITVDCGVTAVEEVEYLKEKGVEVIITDHHEPGDVLPKCTVLNPKVEKKGFYEYCGAGVIFKVIQALFGIKEAEKYLDLVAIATIADVVPLLSDNRIITKKGLDQINGRATCARDKCYKCLLEGKKIEAQDISYRIAPKINASGRMSDPSKAVELFLEDDFFLIITRAKELDALNQKRQELCEIVIKSALESIKHIDFNKEQIIVLYGEDWDSGVIGIASSKICEMFHLPVILFQSKDGILKGSARSIPEVNLHECLSEVTELCIAFGGHSMAAGVTITQDNFAEFRKRINEIVMSKYTQHAFRQQDNEEILTLDANTKQYIADLKYLEPTGMGNPKPRFILHAENVEFEQISISEHVKSKGDKIDLIGFSKYSYLKDMGKFVAEYKIYCDFNEYGGTSRLQGNIVSLNVLSTDMTDEEYDVLNLHQLKSYNNIEVDKISEKGVERLAKVGLGNLFVFNSLSEYEDCKNEKIKGLPYRFLSNTNMLPITSVVIAPWENFDFKYYKNVVFMKTPMSLGYIYQIPDYVKTWLLEGEVVSPPSISDNELREIASKIQLLGSGNRQVYDIKSLYKVVNSQSKVNYRNFRIVCNIMLEIGLITLEKKNIIIEKKAVEWEKSAIYKNLKS